eukprot:8673072-Pyramimonas_sp.AAC.1
MPRDTLLASRVPWVSWGSMALPWRARRSHAKHRLTFWGLRVGFLVEACWWTGLHCMHRHAQGNRHRD